MVQLTCMNFNFIVTVCGIQILALFIFIITLFIVG